MKIKHLYHKYNVQRVDNAENNPSSKHYNGCDLFVLDISHDPFAIPALKAYAEACKTDYPILARDLVYKASLKEGK